MSLLAELLQLLVPALELTVDEAASLGLEVNWQKTKIQALGRTEGVPLTVTVKDHEVVVDERKCLYSLRTQFDNRPKSTNAVSCVLAVYDKKNHFSMKY